MDDDGKPRADGADAGTRLLEEQQARIAALRAAVLSGRVPDQEAFDYARFFGGPGAGAVPEDAPEAAPER